MNNRALLFSPRRFFSIGVPILLVAAFSAPRCAAQQQEYPSVRSVDGGAIFRAYCASCHGLDGKGHGPVASALKSKVPDLTLLTKKSRGVFPRERIRSVIEGTSGAPAHGSREMPVWGPVFHQIDVDQDLGNVRVDNLASYIQSIQGK